MSLILVVNIHGKINSSAPVRQALTELKVTRKFTASVVPDDAATTGALKLCKDYVAWTPLESGLLSKLLEEKGMVSTSRRLDSKALQALGFKSHAELAERMVTDGTRITKVKGILPYFRLAPPRGGFKRSMRRQSSEGGMLGNNPRLPELVERMM